MGRVLYGYYGFSSGEWSPLMEGRVDVEQYRYSCRELLNAIPLLQGPAKKRPGTTHIGIFNSGTYPLSDASRIIPVRTSVSSQFAVVLGDEEAGVYDAGTLTAKTVTTPAGYQGAFYTADDATDVQYASFQSDVFMAHPDYHPKAVQQQDDGTWEIGDLSFVRPPMRPENLTSTYIESSAATGSVTLTASAAVFDAQHVGGYWGFKISPDLVSDLWVTSDSIGSTEVLRYFPSALRPGALNLYRSASTGTTGNLSPVHETGTVNDAYDGSGVDWEFVRTDLTCVRITGFTSDTEVTATVVGNGEIPTEFVTATLDTDFATRWAEGEWSDLRGWPGSVAYGVGRVWFGGSSKSPNTVWASHISDPTDFEVITANDSAGINFAVTSSGGMLIRWLDYSSSLIIGSSAGIHSVTSTNGGAPLPSDILPSHDTKTPVSSIHPVRAGGDLIYTNEAKNRLYSLTIGGDDTRYSTQDITVQSEHVYRASQVVELMATAEGDTLVWAVHADGTMSSMVYAPDIDVLGVSRHVFPFVVSSCSPFFISGGYNLSIIGAYATEPALLNMDLAGSTVYLDGAVVDSLTGLDHYEGETVQAITDDATHPDVLVTSGSVELNYTPSTYFVIGKAYTYRIATHLPEPGHERGVAAGRPTAFGNIILRVDTAGAGLRVGPGADRTDVIPWRNTVDLMDAGVPYYTGDIERIAYDGAFRRGELVIEHNTGLPFTLVAIFAEVVTND